MFQSKTVVANVACQVSAVRRMRTQRMVVAIFGRAKS